MWTLTEQEQQKSALRLGEDYPFPARVPDRRRLQSATLRRGVAGASNGGGGRGVGAGGVAVVAGSRCAPERAGRLASRGWLESWRERIDAWWMLSPHRDALTSCAGALALHLSSR